VKFAAVFSLPSVARILDLYFEDPQRDRAIAGVAHDAKVSYKTAKCAVGRLLKAGLLYKTRRVGKCEMFALNLQSDAFHSLIHPPLFKN